MTEFLGGHVGFAAANQNSSPGQKKELVAPGAKQAYRAQKHIGGGCWWRSLLC